MAENKITWCQRAWQESESLIEECKHLPFLVQMADGTLPHDAFLKYIQQDCIYLRHYEKEMRLLENMLDSVSTGILEVDKLRRQFRIFAQDAMEAELSLNSALTKGLDKSRQPTPNQCTIDYMEHTKRYIRKRDLPMALASLLPCMWVYNEVGHYIQSISKGENNNPYHEWIKCYTSPIMDQGIPVMMCLANVLAEQQTIQRQAEMRQAFRTSVMMEMEFWKAPMR